MQGLRFFFVRMMVLAVFFATVRPFPTEMGGRKPRWHCQVALIVGGANVCVVTYVVVAVWFCQCFSSSDRSDDDLLVSLSRGLLSVMTQFGNWVIYG